MKQTIPNLKLNDTAFAEVVEIVSPEIFIVSFGGDLIRIKNESQKPLNVGDIIRVRVVQEKPLQFQMKLNNFNYDRLA